MQVMFDKYFRTFCRDIVLSDTGIALIHLEEGENIEIALIVEPTHEFGFIAANFIKMEDWDISYLQQVSRITF